MMSTGAGMFLGVIRRRVVAIAVAVVALASGAAVEAQPSNTERWPFAVYSIGQDSCGKFASIAQDESKVHYYMQYAAGFLTGFNAFNPGVGPQNIKSGRDWEGIQKWLEQWCSSRPLLPFAGALLDLVKTLRER